MFQCVIPSRLGRVTMRNSSHRDGIVIVEDKLSASDVGHVSTQQDVG